MPINLARVLEIAQLPLDPSHTGLWKDVMDIVDASDDLEELSLVISRLHEIAEPEDNRFDMAIMMYMGTHMGTLFLDQTNPGDVEENVKILSHDFSSRLAAAGFVNVAKGKLNNSDKWTSGELSLYIAIALALKAGTSFDFLM